MASRSEWAAWWKAQGEEELRLILWAAWDPIGGVPRDEYDTYPPQIASRLRAGAKVEEIAALLGEIRTKMIGLSADPASDRVVSEKIRDWYEHPFFGTGYPRPAEFKTYVKRQTVGLGQRSPMTPDGSVA